MLFALLGVIIVVAVVATIIALKGEDNKETPNKQTGPVSFSSLTPLEVGPQSSSSFKAEEKTLLKPLESGPQQQAAIDSTIRIFSPGQIALASLIGTPTAGCILIALNFRSVGKSSDARPMVILGIVITVGIMALEYFIPDKLFRVIVTVLTPWWMYRGAINILKHTDIFANIENKASVWKAVGIGIACLFAEIVIMGSILAMTGELK